jgi:hypothetical protein
MAFAGWSSTLDGTVFRFDVPNKGRLRVMKLCYTSGIALTALLIGSAFAADDIKSGPQVGQGLTPFNPLHVNGPDTGKKVCLV